MNNLYNQSKFTGFILGISGYSTFVFLDTLIKKYLVDFYPVFQINFFISLFTLVPIIISLYFLKSWNLIFNNKVHIQLLRGILGTLCGALIINSFKNHSFSEIYPILFSTPLILTIFSYLFLNEKVGLKRIVAVLAGFIGVLIVSRPGTVHFTWSLFGLFISSIILAVNIIIVRKFASSQSAVVFTFWGSISGMIIAGIISIQNVVAIRDGDLTIFLLCGIICGVAALCITGASKILESSTFAPIQYIQLIFGFIFMYIFFNELPDIYEIIGSLIIILSGLFIIYREYTLGITSLVKDQLN